MQNLSLNLTQHAKNSFSAPFCKSILLNYVYLGQNDLIIWEISEFYWLVTFEKWYKEPSSSCNLEWLFGWLMSIWACSTFSSTYETSMYVTNNYVYKMLDSILPLNFPEYFFISCMHVLVWVQYGHFRKVKYEKQLRIDFWFDFECAFVHKLYGCEYSWTYGRQHNIGVPAISPVTHQERHVKLLSQCHNIACKDI